MIICRTPFRISLFGGGSDYPSWYRQHGGCVLGMAINKYCYISVRQLPPFFEHQHRIVHSKIELVKEIDEIEHPVVRASLQVMQPDMGLEIHHDGDLPARSGLGSSSSFTVGIINALNVFQGLELTKLQLSNAAIDMEQNVIKEHVGSQDQVWAATGGMNRIDFKQSGNIDVRPLNVEAERRKELTGNLMLFFTGLSRFASLIAEKKIANLSKRQAHVFKMMEMVDEAENILASASRPLSEIGHLLDEFWQLKKGLVDVVSTPEIDSIYETAIDAGAVGGKLLGAGGGGFMIFYVEPENQENFKKKLSHLIHVPFDLLQ